MADKLEMLVKQTEEALKMFYNDSNQSSRDAAHKCLLQVQQCKDAWHVCWKLLDPSKDIEKQYFGANMLYYKISKCWNELVEDDYVPLKDQIINYICLFSKETKMVYSKLCSGLAAFIIHAVPDPLPKGCEQSVNELQKKLAASSNDIHAIILEYLTTLPEEFTISTLTGPQRTTVRQQLNELIPKVLEMLKSILESSDLIAVHSSALKCLHPWVQYGASIFDCKYLMPIILSKLQDECLIDEASSVLVELLSHPTSFRQENSVYEFLEHLDGFEAILSKAIGENNHEVILNICKILVSVGETHANLIRQATTDNQQRHCLHLVHLILKCTGIDGTYPIDETCSEITFSFWYTLQDELLTINSENVTNYHYYLREAFVALIQTLFQKVQLPDDDVHKGFTSDENEMLRCYRQDIQDTITFVGSLLREQCLHDLTELLKHLVSGEKRSKWQEIEAVLYLLQGTSEFLESDESLYIQTIISLLPMLPSHPKVLESAIYMIGSFCEWLACHPDQIAVVLPILQNGIGQSHLSTACTLSLRDICRESSRSFSKQISIDIVNTCLNFVNSRQLQEKEQVRCIECVGYVLAGLPEDAKQEKQNLTSSLLVEMLQSAIKFCHVDPAGAKAVHHWIQCFSAYFRSSDSGNEGHKGSCNSHPLIPCFTQFLDVVQMITVSTGSEAICQDIMNAISKAVDTIRDPFFTVLPQTSAVIFGIFSKVPSGIVLEVSATIIGMLSDVKESFDVLKVFFERLVTDTLLLFENRIANENPDIVHGFLVVLNRAVKSAPFLLFQNRELHVRALQHALVALSYQETPTIKAASNFFVSYIMIASNDNEASEMLNLLGQDLVTRVLLSIGGLSPRTTVDLFADILMALNRHFISKSSVWLHSSLEQEGFPSKLATDSQKENFKKAVLREKVNKRTLKEIVREFSLVCRGLQGMSYTS